LSEIDLVGFQTTYEELKQKYEVISKYLAESFQTTYEELKLDREKETEDSAEKASRLPMRN